MDGRARQPASSAGSSSGATSLVGIGWFFLRSQDLYGNMLGYGVLEDAFGKTAPPQSLWMLRNPVLLLDQLGLPRPGEHADGKRPAHRRCRWSRSCWAASCCCSARLRRRGRQAALAVGVGPGRADDPLGPGRPLRRAHPHHGGDGVPARGGRRGHAPALPVPAAADRRRGRRRGAARLPGGRRGVYLVLAVAAGVAHLAADHRGLVVAMAAGPGHRARPRRHP